MDLATRKQLYNACDPSEPLVPGAPRYAGIDRVKARGRAAQASSKRSLARSSIPTALSRSVLRPVVARGRGGGGLNNLRTVTLLNNTVSGNSADSGGPAQLRHPELDEQQ